MEKKPLGSAEVLQILKDENLRLEVSRFVDSIAYLWENEPLDGDETADIAQMVLTELDERNGNN